MVVANSLNITSQGTVYKNTSGVFTEIDAGPSGTVLISQGTGVAPSFAGKLIATPGTSTDRAIATWNGTTGAALYNNATAKIDSTGRITNTTQPCFVSIFGTQVNNVTGDGTLYTVIPNAAQVNQGTSYNVSTGVFTAPKTGTYIFNFNLTITGVGAAHTAMITQFRNITTSKNYRINQYNPSVIRELSVGVVNLSGSTIIPMTASDTLDFTIQVSGSTKTISLVNQSRFAGYLAC